MPLAIAAQYAVKIRSVIVKLVIGLVTTRVGNFSGPGLDRWNNFRAWKKIEKNPIANSRMANGY